MVMLENKLVFVCEWDMHVVRSALNEYLERHKAELKDYQVEDIEEMLRRLQDAEKEA